MLDIWKSIILFVVISEISSIPISEFESNGPITSVVEIRMLPRRNKRSIDTFDTGYDLELKAFDKTHKLQLRSAGSSLFTDGFKYHDVDVDEGGKIINIERTPSKREIRSIEQNIYLDPESNAVLKVRDVDGEFHLEGLLDTMRIGRDANNDSQVIATQDHKPESRSHTDYVDLQRPVATPRGISSGSVSVTCEVAIVFDYGNGKTFDFDNAKIMDYLAVMLNAVNNRYATMDDPKIKFKLSGIYTIKSISAQPFIEKSKVAGDKIEITKLLNNYKQWAYENINDLPKHDLLPLLYSYEPSTGTVGLAWLSGACWINKYQKSSLATSVSHDTGGSWKGALTLAHELAHNMGAPHDGDDKAKDCPWSGGYIMSYEGHGTMNKFKFSPCSAEEMKRLIQSTGGACLWTQDNRKPPPPISGDIGDRISMLEMCKKRTGVANATVYREKPDEQCLELACKITMVERIGNQIRTSWKYTTYGELPGDNSACGSGGHCQNGKCVGAG